MLEKKVEKKICKTVADAGGCAYKFSSPARPGVPDRLVILPIPDFMREIISQYVFMIEVKAPGKKTSPLQNAVIDELQTLGITVYIVDDPKWKIPKD
jgi:hypothetical protein